MSTVSFADLQAIIAREFGVTPDIVTRATMADDIDGWDSIAHASLVMAVERRFGVRFDVDEIYSFSDVGAMFDRVEALVGD